MKPLDYGLSIGAGIDRNNFLISAQYEFGLTNLTLVESPEMEISVFSVSVSYFFGGN